MAIIPWQGGACAIFQVSVRLLLSQLLSLHDGSQQRSVGIYVQGPRQPGTLEACQSSSARCGSTALKALFERHALACMHVEVVVLKSIKLLCCAPRGHTLCTQSGVRSMERCSRCAPSGLLRASSCPSSPAKRMLKETATGILAERMAAAQYFSGAQPVVVINDAELARCALCPDHMMSSHSCCINLHDNVNA